MDRNTLRAQLRGFKARYRLWIFALGWAIRWIRLIGGYEMHERRRVERPASWTDNLTLDSCQPPAEDRAYWIRQARWHLLIARDARQQGNRDEWRKHMRLAACARRDAAACEEER